jgi:hypothetical protein
MNGPDHYAEAERLIRRCEREFLPREKAATLLEGAQVHATLAVAAATAEAGVAPISMGPRPDWRHVVEAKS